MSSLLNSLFAVRFSILLGKYLPLRIGAKVSSAFASVISSFRSWEITTAIRTNQRFIHGGTLSEGELDVRVREVLNHAGLCYFDLYHYYNKPEKIEALVPWTDSMDEFVQYSKADQGYVVVAPHLSNFDIVVARLVRGGFQGRVLSYPNPGSGYQLQNRIRESYGLDVTPLGDSSLEAELIEYLKAGGTVATGVDRPVPGRKRRHYVRFFGKPSPLPVGYITTALAAEVPIIVVAAMMLPDGNYTFKYSPPIHLQRYKNKLDDILKNAERVLEEIERFILMAPEQWLMYYPVWPDLLKEDQ
jgi:KDO2-lipid IV(A) lauroyltransferase